MNRLHLLLCVMYVDPRAEPTLPQDVIYVRNSELEMTEALRMSFTMLTC